VVTYYVVAQMERLCVMNVLILETSSLLQYVILNIVKYLIMSQMV